MISPIPNVLNAVAAHASNVITFDINEALLAQETMQQFAQDLCDQLLNEFEQNLDNDEGYFSGSKIIYGHHEDGYQGFLLQTDNAMDFVVVYTPQNDSVLLNHGATHSLLANTLRTNNCTIVHTILAHLGMWALAGNDKEVLGSTHAEAYQQEVDSAMGFCKQRAIQQNIKLNSLRRMIEVAYDPNAPQSEDREYISLHQDPLTKVHYLDFNLDLVAGTASGRVYMPTEITEETNAMKPDGLRLHGQPVESFNLVNLGDTRPKSLHVDMGPDHPSIALFDAVFEGHFVPVSQATINSLCTELEEIQQYAYHEKMVVVPKHEVEHMQQAMTNAVKDDHDTGNDFAPVPEPLDLIGLPVDQEETSQDTGNDFAPVPEPLDLIGLPVDQPQG